jgi:hypothetical protein
LGTFDPYSRQACPQLNRLGPETRTLAGEITWVNRAPAVSDQTAAAPTPAECDLSSHAPKRPPIRKSKLPRRSGISSGDNAPVAARASTKPRQTSGVQSEEGTDVAPRVAATVRSQVVGDSGGLALIAKAKRSDKIAISRDDVGVKPLPDDQRSAPEADSHASIPSVVDGRSPQGGRRTIMARYVFGDELKPGERWKRRLKRR